jgi:hypothetical protein
MRANILLLLALTGCSLPIDGMALTLTRVVAAPALPSSDAGSITTPDAASLPAPSAEAVDAGSDTSNPVDVFEAAAPILDAAPAQDAATDPDSATPPVVDSAAPDPFADSGVSGSLGVGYGHFLSCVWSPSYVSGSPTLYACPSTAPSAFDCSNPIAAPCFLRSQGSSDSIYCCPWWPHG